MRSVLKDLRMYGEATALDMAALRQRIRDRAQFKPRGISSPAQSLKESKQPGASGCNLKDPMTFLRKD